MYKKINEFTESEQYLINEICISENSILIEYEFYKVSGIKQKNVGNKDIKRPILETFEKSTDKIELKRNYLHEFPHSESGKNSLTYKII
ncbi:MAG: hypothetical protein GY849_02425 [Deltaproteobacteria bacterium]|nr:hypothetical protein [Deltaproteobacteria bacterium]